MRKDSFVTDDVYEIGMHALESTNAYLDGGIYAAEADDLVHGYYILLNELPASGNMFADITALNIKTEILIISVNLLYIWTNTGLKDYDSKILELRDELADKLRDEKH